MPNVTDNYPTEYSGGSEYLNIRLIRWGGQEDAMIYQNVPCNLNP